ncbi:MAG TPA: hypothetical protein VK709_00215 [Candidatus Saccharimonadales bacterium]|nr:hypothetical protein [Candidatus Saccharimonadales bacterium]
MQPIDLPEEENKPKAKERKNANLRPHCGMDQIPVMPTVEQRPISTDMRLNDATRKLQPTREKQGAWLRTVFFGALEAALLCCVALFNGYPVVTPDSGWYLRSGAFQVAIYPFRAPGYGAFTRWTSLGTSAWFTTVVQAIVVVYILRETFVYLIGGDRKYVDRCLLFGVSVLAALTSLPWVTSQIMPDVFAGVLFLSAFLLAFASEFRTGQRIVLALLLMISVAAHSSFFPIATLFVAAMVLLKLGRRIYGLRPRWSPVVWVLVPIIAAGLWTSNQNQRMGLGFRLAASQNRFLLATLFSNGMAMDFLRANCPEHPFISCRYLSNPPRDSQDFLWGHPLVHELEGHEDEMEAILHGAIIAYPRRFVVSGVHAALLQLVTLRTGEAMQLDFRADYDLLSDIFAVLPRDLSAFKLARQFNERLFKLTEAVAPVHTAVFWLSVAGCLLFAWTGRFTRINQFFIAAIAFLIFNAAVCGAASEVFNRYQSRVAWIMPLCLIAYVCSLLKERNSGTIFTHLLAPFRGGLAGRVTPEA